MPTFSNHRRLLATLAVTATLPLSITACTSSDSGGGASTSSAPSSEVASPVSSPSEAVTSSAPPSESPSTAADATFGSGCASVPTSGKGSFDGMSKDAVATAASNNPLLSTLVTAVKKAGLVDTLNTTDDITVFAPDNGAFKRLNQKTLTKTLASKSKLTGVLTLHVVKGRIAPADLAGKHKTLNGQSITVTGSGEDFTVNGNAKIVCGNVQTSNATVYIIDHVLMPS